MRKPYTASQDNLNKRYRGAGADRQTTPNPRQNLSLRAPAISRARRAKRMDGATKNLQLRRAY